MDNEAIIGLVVFATILFGGVFLRGLVLRRIFSMRVKLFERGKELLARSDLSKQERAFVNFTLEEYDSFRVGWIVPLAMIRFCVKKPGGGATMPSSCDRLSCLVIPFCLSTLAANPFAFAFTCALLPVVISVGALRRHEGPRQALRDAAREVQPLPWGKMLAHR